MNIHSAEWRRAWPVIRKLWIAGAPMWLVVLPALVGLRLASEPQPFLIPQTCVGHSVAQLEARYGPPETRAFRSPGTLHWDRQYVLGDTDGSGATLKVLEIQLAPDQTVTRARIAYVETGD